MFGLVVRVDPSGDRVQFFRTASTIGRAGSRLKVDGNQYEVEFRFQSSKAERVGNSFEMVMVRTIIREESVRKIVGQCDSVWLTRM